MIAGSCLCGQVKYLITGKVGEIVHCHCSTCRKSHGAAFSSVASVSDDDIKIQGEELLNFYQSSGDKKRYFCSNCGTQIYAKRDDAKHIVLRLGTLDNDPQTIEKSHIWLSQKASWYSLNSCLPEYQEYE